MGIRNKSIGQKLGIHRIRFDERKYFVSIRKVELQWHLFLQLRKRVMVMKMASSYRGMWLVEEKPAVKMMVSG